MTQDQFTLGASSLIRHLLAAAAGLLVARGFTSTGDMVANFSAAAAVFAATLAWSFIQHSKLLSALTGAASMSQIEQLLAQASEFKRTGADPLLVAHMIGTALALAQQAIPPIAGVVAPVSPPAPVPAETVPPSSVPQEPAVSGFQEGTT